MLDALAVEGVDVGGVDEAASGGTMEGASMKMVRVEVEVRPFWSVTTY